MRRLGLLAGVAVLWSTTMTAFAEDITLTTYYPSPRGVYKELRVNDAGLAPSTAALEITQTGTIPALLVNDQAGDPSPFVIKEDGMVLIGTTTVPATNPKVHVEGPVEADAFRAFEGTGVYGYVEGTPNDGWAQLGGYNLGLADYAPTYLDGKPLVLNAPTRSSGNVGIGTANPTAKLQIKSEAGAVGNIWFGDVNEDMAYDGGNDSYFPFVHKGLPTGSTAFCYQNSATQLMTIRNNGNINIGPTSDPANVRALTVSGKVVVNDAPGQRGNIEANDVYVHDASGGNAKWLSGTVTKVGIIIHSNSVPGNDAGACTVLPGGAAVWEPDPVPQVGGLLAASVASIPSTTEHAHVCISRK